jgi:ubiquinone/menaquinone biosynthesis C-methylase UbiE
VRKNRFLAVLPLLLLLKALGTLHAEGQETPRSPVVFNPQDAAQLDQASRDAWQKPKDVVAALKLHAGEVVADVGTGSGYFVPYLSKAVGSSGRVYAIDIQPEMLAFVQRKVAELDLTNVTTVLSQEADTRLDQESVDLAFMVDVYHELGSPATLLSNIRAVLKPGGRLTIIDFKADKEADRVGPPLSHRVPKERLMAELERAGFELTETIDLLPYQYFLVFTGKPETTATGAGSPHTGSQ